MEGLNPRQIRLPAMVYRSNLDLGDWELGTQSPRHTGRPILIYFCHGLSPMQGRSTEALIQRIVSWIQSTPAQDKVRGFFSSYIGIYVMLSQRSLLREASNFSLIPSV